MRCKDVQQSSHKNQNTQLELDTINPSQNISCIGVLVSECMHAG